MYIVMEENKAENSDQVVKILREYEKKYGLTIQTSADQDFTSVMGGSDVSIKLYSDDLDKLRKSAESVERRMRKMKALEDVSDITEDRTEEVHITIDKNEAMSKGLTVAQVYQQIAAKLLEEKEATTLKLEEADIDVMIENASSDYTIEELETMRLTIDKPDGTRKHVRLWKIADISRDASLTEIAHTDQRRSIEVTAGVKDGYNITKTTSQIRSTINKENLLKKGVEAEYGGQNEEIMHSMKQLLLMMLVGFMLVYLIMVAQFQWYAGAPADEAGDECCRNVWFRHADGNRCQQCDRPCGLHQPVPAGRAGTE